MGDRKAFETTSLIRTMAPTGTSPQERKKAQTRALLRRLRTYSYTSAYILAVHYGYVTYIHPTFEYAHYKYLSFSTVALFSTYFLTWLPVVVYRTSAKPAQAAAALIYALSYVPIQLSLLFSVERSYDQLFWVQAMLALSMTVLFLVAKGKSGQRRPRPFQFRSMDRVVVPVTLIAVSLMVAVNRDHMRMLSFADVYDQRFEAAAAARRSVFSDYLTSWLIYCFISYLFARGLVHRKWSLLLLGLACAILIYMSEGHKSAILLLPITVGMFWLWGSGRYFLSRLLSVLTGLIAVVSFVVPDQGLGLWVKSILLVRVVGSGGWLASKYLEYFTPDRLTYYSHIRPINKFTGNYPFGDLSLGQVIGLEYSGTIEANHNASFWASDGFAAAGPVGVLIITPVVAGLLYAMNRIMAHLDTRFVVLWMCGFFVAFLNVPLSTALLSGGGLIIFGQAWLLSQKVNRPVGPA
jgi:hypothetical protein